MQSSFFLMGMPGSGKSTLGKRLAAKLNVLFIDLDEYIVQKEKKTIETIFELHGEALFRELERNYLLEIINSGSVFLLALGGGSPCFNNNIELI